MVMDVALVVLVPVTLYEDEPMLFLITNATPYNPTNTSLPYATTL